MPQRIALRIMILAIVVSAPAIFAPAQSASSTEILDMATRVSWQSARSLGASKRKLFVVTLEQPQRRQACHVKSFTPDKLVCSRAFGGSRTFLPKQVLALIVPGDGAVKLQLVIGFNAGLGAAIWGTVVLAATCPACAAATAFAAVVFFSAAGATLIGDDQPERLIYVAPGQQLTCKLYRHQLGC